MYTYLLDRGPKDLVELIHATKSTVQFKRVKQRKPTQSKLDITQKCQRSLQCYRCQGYGHRQSECLISSGKDQKSSMPVGQSNQKTHAMVAKTHEDGEKAFTCVNMERPLSSGNSKKSNLSRLTSNMQCCLPCP